MHFKLYFRANGRKQVFPLVGADEEDSNDVMQIGKQESNRENPNQYRIYDMNGCGACLSTMGGGGSEPHTAIPMFGIDYNKGGQERQIANTISTSCEQDVPVIWYDKYNCYIAIRKLTPRECWRLQSFTDEEFDKAQFVNSDSQLYKQAGNSVTVNVVYEIGKALR